MPKEKVYNRYYGQFAIDHSECGTTPCAEECNGKPVPMDDSFVKLGWSKEGEHVEIAIMREADDEVHNERWHSQLDRTGINRLIRILRQARDDAYGRDE